MRHLYVEILKSSINAKGLSCFIPVDIFNSLGLSEALCYTLHAGKLAADIYPIPYESNKKAIYLNDLLMKELYLYENMQLNIWKENNHIYLGPVVGVLVTKEDLSLIKTGVIPNTLTELFKANEKSHCLLYYFSNENFYINYKKVYGYTKISSSGELLKLALPIADTIYEQLNSASQIEYMIFQYMRKILTHYFDIQYINNHMYLGKWEIYKCLLSQTELNPYLPKTIPFDDFEDVKLFIDYFGKVILKPSYKSSKLGTLYIEKDSNIYYLYSKLQDKLLTASSTGELESFIADYTKEELFIIQQSFFSIKTVPESMHVLLGKNSKGKWIVVDSPECLQKSSLESLFLKLGICIEKCFGHFGEIELAVILDSYEKPWIVDINIPPSNLKDYSHMYENYCKLRYLSILEYSKYLTIKNYESTI